MFQTYHKPLFENNNALKLGKIHCIILVAYNAFEEKAIVQKDEKEKEFNPTPLEFTAFGKETAGNFIKWWVRKHTGMLGEINRKITEVKYSLDRLKRDSEKLAENSSASTYEELIDELCDFVEKHNKDIDALHRFVLWLKGLDELSPCVLFNHPPWSITQLSERYLKIEQCNDTAIQRCVETVLGLKLHDMPTLATIRNEMESEWAESVDPEFRGSSPITFKAAFHRASRKILNEFALYFLKIRDSVHLIRSEIDSFLKEDILYNKEFMKLFISKAVHAYKSECVLWDFKKTISAWYNTENKKLKVDFACNVASFANSKGGLIIIGITDNGEICGVKECKRRIRQSRSILERYLDSDLKIDLIDIYTMPVPNGMGNLVNCLIIKIPQSKDVVGVKGINDKEYLFPVREDDGIKYCSFRQVSKMKENVLEDNFLFAKNIAEFVYYH